MYNPYNQKLQNKLQKLWGKFITRSYEKKCAIPIIRSYGVNYKTTNT